MEINLFLGYGEYQLPYQNFKQLKKFEYLPFVLIQASGRKLITRKEYEILFVGNDGKRDFELLKKIIQENSKLNLLLLQIIIKIDFKM